MSHADFESHASPDDLEDRLDATVAEYSDRVGAGQTPNRRPFLERVPPAARPALERCLKMIDAGLARAPGALQPLAPGRALGRYELLREIGRGGMALVWLARDTELRRPVALKILRPGLALERSHVDRFRREALAIARLKNPSIVQIHDVGSAEGFHFLAMEYIEGPSLASVLEALGSPPSARHWSADELARAAGIPALARRAGTLEQALAALLVPVAEALATAHASGVVHRDVKPSNVLLRQDGTAVVVDFGLAKAEGDPALSLTGDPLGTPYYMSPEQASMAKIQVDHRTDLYSLGVCLFEALAGVRPYEGPNVLEVFEKIRVSVPPSLSSLEPRVSRDGAALVRKAMARTPEGRYTNAEALAKDLRAVAEGLPTSARQAEGGAWRRAMTALRLHFSGLPFEYRSHRTFLGLPLAHVISGQREPGRPKRVARGWFASSPEVAIGGLALGQRAYGLVACGAFSCGLLFSWGALAAGLGFAVGGMALGTFPFGGVAMGYLAIGGFAVGHGAIGGLAIGHYAIGSKVYGDHVITERHRDLSEEEFFHTLLRLDLAPFRLFGGDG